MIAHAVEQGSPSTQRVGGETGLRNLAPKLFFLSLAFCAMFAMQQGNYLLFHSFVEIFCIVVASGIFILVWHSRLLMRNAYFKVLGVGYLFVAVFDFMHMLTFPGMGIFTQVAEDSAIQTWVVSRSLESFSLLAAPICLLRSCRLRLLLPAYAAVCLMILAAIFIWRIFPACHIPGLGMTTFKIGSVFFIIAALGASLILLHLKGQELDADVRRLMVGATILTIMSEVSLAMHSEVNASFNVAGNYFKFVSFYLIYQAVLQSGLIRPYGLLAGYLRPEKSALLESQAAFTATMNASLDMIVFVDARLRCMAANRTAAKMLGRQAGALTGAPLEDVFPVEQYPRLVPRMNQAFQTGVCVRFETQLGKTFCSIDLQPIFNARAEVVRLALIGRDITRSKVREQDLIHSRDEMESRAAERTVALSRANRQLEREVAVRSTIVNVLKQKNLLFRSLVRAIPDMVAYKDTQERYLIANPAFKSFFGVEHEKIINRTDSELLSVNTGQLAMDWDRQVIANGKPLRIEASLTSADGQEGHWDIRKVPVKDPDGGLKGVLCLARDITAVKQRETQLQHNKALLQSFLDGISEPMMLLDEHLRPLYVNRAANEVWDPQNRMPPGEKCHRLLCADVSVCENCAIPDRIAENRYHSFERRRGRNAERIERVELIPCALNQEGLNGTIVRVTDLTEAKQIEHHLVHGEKMTALGMLVSGIIHEINNPNSFIGFNLPILQAYIGKMFEMLDTMDSAEKHGDWFGLDYPAFREEIFSLLENLSHGSQRINKIVGNLKAVSHPRQSSSATQRADLGDVIDKAVTLCRNKVRKHVNVFDVGALKEKVWLLADPEGLEQVLINLLINAAQAADKADAWIRLNPRMPQNGDCEAAIEISDNGCGIEADHIEQIFDPFFTTKGPGVGTGLGLSMSYNLVHQMGGSIDVQSTPREGTVFTIRLPVADVPVRNQDAGVADCQVVP